jgi:hypothetical protein
MMQPARAAAWIVVSTGGRHLAGAVPARIGLPHSHLFIEYYRRYNLLADSRLIFSEFYYVF